MKLFYIFFTFLFITIQSAKATSIDETINSTISPFTDTFAKIIFYPINLFGVKIPLTILIMILAGIFLTFFLRWLSIWGFKHSLQIIFKTNKKNTDTKDGEVTSLQALATALSGTIGMGNIAGVAIAISVGGPGALLWMVFGALFGMTTKFIECYLGVKYRRFNPDGSISGGPMYYIAHGLTRKKMRWLGQPLAFLFALMLIPGAIGAGNMLQVNQAAQQFIYITGGKSSFFYSQTWVFGLIIAIIVGIIIVGGIKKIAKVTEKIVPFMCLLYIVSALIVVIAHFADIPSAIMLVFREAFAPTAVVGGVAGSIIMGFRKSCQSNEAGIGSAPIAYATAKTKEPVSQGFVALMEPFLDTAVVCSLTALVIILTGMHSNFTSTMSGVDMTSSAFESVMPFYPYVLAIVIILFALSTTISWAYYGQKGWTYIVGEGPKRIKFYQIIFCIIIVIGSSMNLKSIIDFSDATYLAMAMINLTAIFILLPEVKKDVIEYSKKYKIAQIFNKNWYEGKD